MYNFLEAHSKACAISRETVSTLPIELTHSLFARWQALKERMESRKFRFLGSLVSAFLEAHSRTL